MAKIGANMDKIQAILKNISILKKQYTFIKIIHLKGHQDKNIHHLSVDEQLNVQSNKLAMPGLEKRKIQNIKLPEDRAQLHINNKKVASDYTMHLCKCFHSITMYAFFKKKYNWQDAVLKNKGN
jgi:hypothetical protein